jgi:phosphatidate cytidylyltransferase
MNIKEVLGSSIERILTGVILLGIAILMVAMDSLFLTWAILGIAYMLSFREAMRLFGEKDDKFYIYAVLIWIAAAFYPHPTDLVFVILIVAVSIMTYRKDVKFRALAPFLYPVIPMVFLFTLYKDFGIYMLIWLVVIVASTDVAAYFVGKCVGKTPFSEMSPNKTWEGVLGGIAAGTVIGASVGLMNQPILFAIFTSLLVSVASVWGDLFESYLKREAGVKDSGTIFPGHGGFLDRLDGYLFGVVIMVVIIRGVA